MQCRRRYLMTYALACLEPSEYRQPGWFLRRCVFPGSPHKRELSNVLDPARDPIPAGRCASARWAQTVMEKGRLEPFFSSRAGVPRLLVISRTSSRSKLLQIGTGQSQGAVVVAFFPGSAPRGGLETSEAVVGTWVTTTLYRFVLEEFEVESRANTTHPLCGPRGPIYKTGIVKAQGGLCFFFFSFFLETRHLVCWNPPCLAGF